MLNCTAVTVSVTVSLAARPPATTRGVGATDGDETDTEPELCPDRAGDENGTELCPDAEGEGIVLGSMTVAGANGRAPIWMRAQS